MFFGSEVNKVKHQYIIRILWWNDDRLTLRKWDKSIWFTSHRVYFVRCSQEDWCRSCSTTFPAAFSHGHGVFYSGLVLVQIFKSKTTQSLEIFARKVCIECKYIWYRSLGSIVILNRLASFAGLSTAMAWIDDLVFRLWRLKCPKESVRAVRVLLAYQKACAQPSCNYKCL